MLQQVSELARQARAGKHEMRRILSRRERARRSQAGKRRNAALTFAGNELTSSGLIDAYELAESALRQRTGGTQSTAALMHRGGGAAA